MFKLIETIKDYFNPIPPLDNSTIKEENWVTARIWLAKTADGAPTTSEKVVTEQVKQMAKVQTKGLTSNQAPGNVGHASVQMDNTYVSLWPLRGINKNEPSPSKQQARTALEPLSPEQIAFLETNYGVSAAQIAELREGRSPTLDERDEGGVADVTQTFYSLDRNAIQQEYEAIKQSDYKLTDKANPKLENPTAKNCSTMAYSLLSAGGINRLSFTCRNLENGLTPLTPNALAACIEDAKKNELKKFPQTQNFVTPQDNDLSTLFKKG